MDWKCNRCNFIVFGRKPACNCGNTRLNNPVGTPKTHNDWWCNSCKCSVFGSKTHCSVCKISRTDNSNVDTNLCQICLSSEFQKNAMNCGHVICKKCLETIQTKDNKCPFCKVDITSSINLFI